MFISKAHPSLGLVALAVHYLGQHRNESLEMSLKLPQHPQANVLLAGGGGHSAMQWQFATATATINGWDTFILLNLVASDRYIPACTSSGLQSNFCAHVLSVILIISSAIIVIIGFDSSEEALIQVVNPR